MNRRLLLVPAAVAVAAVAMGNSVREAERRASDEIASTAIDSLGSPAAPGSTVPNLVTGPDGRVYLSWLEPMVGGHALRFAVHDGTRWSTPGTIIARNDFFVNWADFPSMEVLDGNHLVAHWLQRNGTGTYAYGVRISQSADGGKSWSEPVTPHRDNSPSEHGFVAMWREPSGTGAVWLDGRKFKQAGHGTPSSGHGNGNEMMLVSTTVQRDGTLGAEVRLDERTCDCCQNAAVMTSSGPVIAYRDRTMDEIRDIYVTRRVGGTWQPGVAVHNDNWKIAACPVNGPALAARGNQVAIAWFTAPADSGRINVAFSDNAGATFTAPVRVDGGNPAGRVDVAFLSDGDAVVTWVERIGGDIAAVRARRVGRDGKVGAATTVASSTAARSSGFPRMAVTGSHVMFAWTVPGRPSHIRVARATASDFR